MSIGEILASRGELQTILDLREMAKSKQKENDVRPNGVSATHPETVANLNMWTSGVAAPDDAGYRKQRCSRCDEEKDIREFSRTNNGTSRRSVCKKCCSHAIEESRRRNAEARRVAMSMKTCSKCGQLKPRREGFYATPDGRDGLRAECKECYLASRRAYKAKQKAAQPAPEQPQVEIPPSEKMHWWRKAWGWIVGR